MEDWVSITEAAKRLTASGDAVERSTLSRYITQHSEALPTKIDGRNRLVDYNTLCKHRQENVRILPQAASPQPRRFIGSQADGAARKAQADAELREMDLAERRKILTRTAEVDRAGRDAIALMQSAFERSIETSAADLSLKYGWDERIVRTEFKKFAALGTENFNRVMLAWLDDLEATKEETTDDST